MQTESIDRTSEHEDRVAAMRMVLEDEFIAAVLRRDPDTLLSNIPAEHEPGSPEQRTVLATLDDALFDDGGVILRQLLIVLARHDPACVRLMRLVAENYARQQAAQLIKRGAL